jgi:hypothetical protein
MSTTATIVTTHSNTDTAAFPRTPEAHLKSTLTKAEIAMRIELRRAIDTMTESSHSDRLNDWERHYLGDLISKFQQYGLATRLSLAQVMTMNRCIAKATA